MKRLQRRAVVPMNRVSATGAWPEAARRVTSGAPVTTDSILPFPRTAPSAPARARPQRMEEHAMNELRLQTVEVSSPPPPTPGARLERLSAEEWQRRFMARIHAVSGFSVNAAATWPEGYAGLSKGYEADPEAAAGAHLSYWLD